jgi:hypothetical protein
MLGQFLVATPPREQQLFEALLLGARQAAAGSHPDVAELVTAEQLAALRAARHGLDVFLWPTAVRVQGRRAGPPPLVPLRLELTPSSRGSGAGEWQRMRKQLRHWR